MITITDSALDSEMVLVMAEAAADRGARLRFVRCLIVGTEAVSIEAMMERVRELFAPGEDFALWEMEWGQ